jgi:hypothetical protein
MEICLNEIFGNENCDNEEEGIELNEIKSNEEDNE